ncbi:MAG: Chromate resistance protein ChrB [Acidimicrobiia bacterium]
MRIADSQDSAGRDPEWLLLAYKVPSEPSSNRIAIWRELKRLGAYYPQHAVCLLPGRLEIRERIGKIRERITDMGGTDTYLEIPFVPDDQHAELLEIFTELAAREYAEIVEECESKFVKEIEFERFRENYTFEEVEEIRQDLDKIRRWFDDVAERDWFGSTARSEAESWVKECGVLLESFEADVFERTEGSDD